MRTIDLKNKAQLKELDADLVIPIGAGTTPLVSRFNYLHDDRGISCEDRDAFTVIFEVIGTMPSGTVVSLKLFSIAYGELADITSTISGSYTDQLVVHEIDNDLIAEADFVQFTYNFKQGGAPYTVSKLFTNVKKKPSLGGAGTPEIIKGNILVSTDFPLIADVQVGWTYFVAATVTDNAGVLYTNTGQSFVDGDRIVWNGTDWSLESSTFVYTNASPMPEDVGGFEAGTTFSSSTSQQLWDGLLYPYQYPAFTAFGFGQSSPIEVGLTLSGVKTFTWTTSNSTNVFPNTLVIRDVTGAVDLGTGLANDGTEDLNIGSVQKTSATSNVWRITGTNTKSGTFSRDVTIAWQWRRYYGESVTTPLVEASIEALRVGDLSSGFAGTYAFLGGGYKYLCYATVLGTATTFKDASTNLDIPFETVYTVLVTNGNGIATNYNVHRSTNILGGAVNIVVS